MKSIFKLFNYKLIFNILKDKDFIIFSEQLHEYFLSILIKKNALL